MHLVERVRAELAAWYPSMKAGSWIFIDDVDSYPYRRGNRKASRRKARALDEIHAFLRDFLAASEATCRLRITYGSTGLATLEKLSPLGTVPRMPRARGRWPPQLG